MRRRSIHTLNTINVHREYFIFSSSDIHFSCVGEARNHIKHKSSAYSDYYTLNPTNSCCFVAFNSLLSSDSCIQYWEEKSTFLFFNSQFRREVIDNKKNNNISLRVCVAVFCGYVCWVFVTHKWDDIQLNTIARANEAPVRAILYELLSCCFYSIPPGGREKV